MAYRKPTLIETYVELHLGRGSLTEGQFFDVVPALKKLGYDDIELTTVGLSLDIKQGRPAPREKQRVRCWKPGRRELVQVGEDLLVVNLTGEYPGWDAFLKIFSEAQSALIEGLSRIQIKSINLGSIDRFEVPIDDYSFSSYFDVGGKVVPAWYSNSREAIDIDLGSGILESDGRNRQIHIDVRIADSVIIGIRCQFHDAVSSGADLDSVLAQLHDESNEAFESIITDSVREQIMGGKKQ